LGFDPIEIAGIDRKTKYLMRVCADLPGVGTEGREILRKGISLKQALAKISAQRDDKME
jgi:hypothetical protein